jgi:hypothetical protein
VTLAPTQPSQRMRPLVAIVGDKSMRPAAGNPDEATLAAPEITAFDHAPARRQTSVQCGRAWLAESSMTTRAATGWLSSTVA